MTNPTIGTVAMGEETIREAFNEFKKRSLKNVASYYDFAAGYDAALSTRPAQEPVAWLMQGDGWGMEIVLSEQEAKGRADRIKDRWSISVSPLYAAPQPAHGTSATERVPTDQVKVLEARIAGLEGKLAEAIDTLKFYATPEIYKPHPHGPAFDRRDLSFSATSTLSTLIGGEA